MRPIILTTGGFKQLGNGETLIVPPNPITVNTSPFSVTVLDNSGWFLIDTSSLSLPNFFEVNLPSAVNLIILDITNSTPDAVQVRLNPTGAETVNKESSFVISEYKANVTIASDGVDNWWIK